MIYKLKDICIKVTDGSHFSPKAQEEGYPMFSVKDMLEYGFNYTSCKRISKQDFEKMQSSGCVPQEGDVLVAKDGSYLKEIFVCTETKNEAILSSIAIFRPNQEIVNPYYLCYLLKSPQIYNYIASNCVSGSALPRIVLKDFKEVEMQVPDMSTQTKIVNILKNIDGKIQNNYKINRNLSEQASAYYENWKMSLIGEAVELSKVIDVRDGTHASPKPQDEGYPLVTSKHLFEYDVDLESPNKISQDDYDKTNERSKVEYHDVLMSMIGTVGVVSFISRQEINFAIKNVALFRTSQREELAYYVLLFLKSKDTKQYIKSCMAGSTQQYISLTELRKIPIIVPGEEIKEFNLVIKPIIDMICANVIENRRLSELRDTLLPKLMSGELDVSDLGI